MSFKGTASKSSSGASMSKYDVEVEARLQKLEQAVSSISNIEAMVSALEGAVDRCKAECNAKSSGGGSDPRVDKIISHIAKNEDVSDLT